MHFNECEFYLIWWDEIWFIDLKQSCVVYFKNQLEVHTSMHLEFTIVETCFLDNKFDIMLLN